MKKTDVLKLQNAYNQLIKEDLGLGPQAISPLGGSSGGQGVVLSLGGLENPNAGARVIGHPKEDGGKEMAEGEMKSIIEDAQRILQDLQSNGDIEDWVLAKIVTVSDRLNSVRKFLDQDNDK